MKNQKIILGSWTLKVGYTSGLVQYFQISNSTMERLRNLLHDASDKGSRDLCFSSDNFDVCLSMQHVMLIQFLVDAFGVVDLSKIHSSQVTIFFHNQNQPIYFMCEPDVCKMDEETCYEDVQFQSLRYYWEGFSKDQVPYLRLYDEDGEMVLLNRQHVAAILIPKSLADPDFEMPQDLGDEELDCSGISTLMEGDGKYHQFESRWAAGCED